MSAKKAAAAAGKGGGGEKLEFRSPAEFFASNQNIAGFDNVRAGGAACSGEERARRARSRAACAAA